MMDYLLSCWMGGLVQMSKLNWMLGRGRPWQPGKRFRLLFAGYNGARNTGADVRVEEMIRQVRRILGDDQIRVRVLTQNPQLTQGYFGDATQLRIPDVFPGFINREVAKCHGLVACEGSMFKSKFANALTVMMIGSLGMAAARNRLSIGYGAEAGKMDPFVRRMCRRCCNDSLVVARNTASREILRPMGVNTEVGTDTAWTFEPHESAYGKNALREKGWDGRSPILVVCPINPFWWPVKASLAKAAACTLTGAYRKSRYRSVYFHRSGGDVDRKYNQYLDAIANAVRGFRERRNCFVVMAAMERLDARACNAIAERLDGAAVFTSDDYDMYQLVSILRCCSYMVSSRYHGIVTSMPGLVPSAGITMDERIRNLLTDRGHADLLLEVDQPDLEERLTEVLDRLHRRGEEYRDGIGRDVVRNLKLMARMGVFFVEHMQKRHPDFPIQNGLRSWEDYLPPLSPDLSKLVETYGG